MKKTKILLVGALLLGVPSVALSLSTQQENATVVRAATTNNYKWVSASEDAQIFGSNTNGTATLNGLDWEFTREKANFCNYTSSTLQFGKNGGSDGAITLVNKNTKNIKYIKVECASYNATSNIKISIGEEIYLNSTKTAKWSNNKTGVVGGTVLSTPISGDVKIEFTASNRALYLKSIELQYEEDQNAKKYTVTYDATGGSCEKENDIYVEGNVGLTLPTAKKDGYKLSGWFDKNGNKVESPFAPTEDITLYAKWEELNTVVDKITAENLSATNTTYKEFTYKSSLTNIEYKGITANNNGIQINGKNNYGIVVTKSNYIIKNITIEWNSSTTADKELSIYTSTEAYTNSSDLYNHAVPVTSLSKNDATTYSFETNYNYVGIRSKSGMIVLNSISFEWELDKSKPTIDSTILATDYLCTNLMHDNNGNISITKAIRFIGSVNETKFADLQKVGFNFTLNNTTNKEYNTELSKLYHIIDDSDKAFDKESDEIYVKDGYLNYSLILNNIPDDFTGTITYYAFATINDINYQTEAITIKLVSETESK